MLFLLIGINFITLTILIRLPRLFKMYKQLRAK